MRDAEGLRKYVGLVWWSQCGGKAIRVVDGGSRFYDEFEKVQAELNRDKVNKNPKFLIH